jgi:tetratricopeptide (TPR) repeat protein
MEHQESFQFIKSNNKSLILVAHALSINRLFFCSWVDIDFQQLFQPIENATKAVLYSNRSFAYLKTESFGAALEDAGKGRLNLFSTHFSINLAIELDPKYTKGYYRRASANMAMGQFSKALKDYESVFKVKPKDPDVRKKVQECRKVLFYNEKISAFENRN